VLLKCNQRASFGMSDIGLLPLVYLLVNILYEINQFDRDPIAITCLKYGNGKSKNEFFFINKLFDCQHTELFSTAFYYIFTRRKQRPTAALGYNLN